MTLDASTYDLTIVLDPQAEEATQAKIVADARAAIEGDGELLRHDDWGERALAYQINHRTSGHYHLLQFHPGSAALLAGLNRTLHITDGVLRFRIIKLRPGVPEAPDLRTARPAESEASRPAESEASRPAESEAARPAEGEGEPSGEAAPAPASA